ncbi:hypothetical protein KDW_07010 [Dictyobacter vulcani]|uniref:Type I restriction modification DNA specificity domain-containing protein n=1 Tax=Dictyobacter vulcani TaxID=2607529 RepID=A0A5J4KK45_9CHLR|nr:restriction endonuclease subunit S [Dictyobacter vulcani]GER86539.1 hypothetical protein KDW_07010 [Dictyobacter vulcani]
MIEMLAGELVSLPSGWKWQKVEDLLYEGHRDTDIRQGKNPSSGLTEYIEGKIPFYEGGDVKGRKFLENATRSISEKAFKSTYQLAPYDLLIKRIGSYAGQSSILKEEASANAQIFGARFNQQKVDVAYIYWWFKSKYVRDRFANALKGANQRYITKNDIAELPIPIPYPGEDRSLVTQHLLLQRLEARMKDLDISCNLHERMNKSVDRLLEAALEDIFSESSRNTWKNKGRIRDFVECFEKVEKRVKIDRIDDIKLLRYIIGSDIAEGTGVLVGNRTWNESNVQRPPYLFAAGTVLYQMRDIDLRRVAYVNFDGSHGEDIYPLRILSTVKLSPRFLKWLLLTPHFTQYAIENSEDESKGEGKKRPRLNKRKLLDYKIAFPDEDDQQRILSNLELVLTNCNELQVILAEEKTAIEQLEMSILDQAFLKGKL